VVSVHSNSPWLPRNLKNVQNAEVGAQIKSFNTQAQIAQPKFLIGKTQAQIAKVKNKIRKAQAQIAQEKIKSVKRKRKLRKH